MAKKEAAKTEEITPEERDRLLQKAYTAATQELRSENRDRFNELYAARAKDQGVEWKPRPSAEQRAQEQFDALLNEYPHLADRLAGEDEEADHAADEEDEEGGAEK